MDEVKKKKKPDSNTFQTDIRTWLSDCSNVDTLLLRHVTQNWENGKAWHEAGRAVQQTKIKGVSANQKESIMSLFSLRQQKDNGLWETLSLLPTG